jgi:endonuclease/exonuclease/phosphatase family metal-dependent hydrolase
MASGAGERSSAVPILHVGARTRTIPDEPGSLHVVSWNIQFGVESVAAASALNDVHSRREIDLVLLQEMDEAGTDLIAGVLGMNFVFGALGPHRQTGRSFGNAVLSRWPLTDPAGVELPHKSFVQGQERLVVGATATIGETEMAAWSVHAEVPTLGPGKRRRQFDEIALASGRTTHERLVVGGDFNTLTRRGVAVVDRAMSAIGAARVTADAERTLRRGGREFALDHIYARGLESVECGVIPDLQASDHRPLWVLLRA